MQVPKLITLFGSQAEHFYGAGKSELSEVSEKRLKLKYKANGCNVTLM